MSICIYKRELNDSTGVLSIARPRTEDILDGKRGVEGFAGAGAGAGAGLHNAR